VLSLVEEGVLTYGHARTLISVAGKFDDDFVMECATYIIKNDLSVRETERYIKSILSAPAVGDTVNEVEKSYYKQLEKKVSAALGRVVSIKLSADGKGNVKLNYSDSDDLEKILRLLCGNDFFDAEN
jgi:ParB family chromosome partitioning protein